MIPGLLLHRLAVRICSVKSLERIIEPTIADLQREFADGGTSRWRSIRRLSANYLAVLWVIGICTLGGSEAMDDERDMIGHTLLWACTSTTAATLLLTVPPLSVYPEVRGWYAFFTVVPQALPLAIPFGLALGLAVGLSGRVTRSVTNAILLAAFIASLLSFGAMSWGMPAGNQAFRELAFRTLTAQAKRSTDAPLRKGPNEMTLSELRREIRNVAGAHERRWYSWTFHLRFTLPVAVMAITAFMIVVPIEARWLRALLALFACFVYLALIFAGELGVRHDYLRPVLAAWLPNIVVMAAALFLMSRARYLRLAAEG
jgi:lipopolysaccharide export LptBFGC system permease protein LptF